MAKTRIRIQLPAEAAARLAAVPLDELSKALGAEVLAITAVPNPDPETEHCLAHWQPKPCIFCTHEEESD